LQLELEIIFLKQKRTIFLFQSKDLRNSLMNCLGLCFVKCSIVYLVFFDLSDHSMLVYNDPVALHNGRESGKIC